MRITISISDITKRVYAISAIRAVNAPEGYNPAVLTRDNALLLRRLIRDSFARTVGSLGPRVEDFSSLTPDDDGDILWLEIIDVPTAAGVAVEMLSTAVLGTVLSLAYTDSEPGSAREYASVAAEALSGLRRAGAHCGRLQRRSC